LVTYLATSRLAVSATSRLIATTDLPVPGPPSTTTTASCRGRGFPCDRERSLIDDFLVVHQYELLLAGQHPGQALHQSLEGRIRPFSTL